MNMADKKLKTEYFGYPSISKIEGTDSKIMHSPFANCQSYCINNAGGFIKYVNGDYLLELFTEIFNEIAKSQFVIDIKQSDESLIISNLAFLISYKQAMYYINTNGTPMVLYLIQLDRDKLK